MFFGILLLTACTSEPAEELSREPINVIEADGVKVEVYDYEHILPFLERENDKINVVNFWATWCVPCVAELPYFEKLREENNDVTVTLISLDFVQQVPSSLIPYIIKNKLKSEVIVLDDSKSNEWIPKVDEDWSGALPATIIYTNTDRKFYEESFTYQELETEVKQFKK